MWRLAALAALCVGCTSTDYSATIVVKRLEGAYRFDYGPIAFERPDTTWCNDPEATRTGGTFFVGGGGGTLSVNVRCEPHQG